MSGGWWRSKSRPPLGHAVEERRAGEFCCHWPKHLREDAEPRRCHHCRRPLFCPHANPSDPDLRCCIVAPGVPLYGDAGMRPQGRAWSRNAEGRRRPPQWPRHFGQKAANLSGMGTESLSRGSFLSGEQSVSGLPRKSSTFLGCRRRRHRFSCALPADNPVDNRLIGPSCL
jgi:hypothetical protein